MNRMWPALYLFAVPLLAASSTTEWPTGNRTTPPIINSVSPRGVPRGTTTELTIDGLNLAHSSDVFFSEPGVQARILRIKELPDLPDIRFGSNNTISTVDLGPLPPHNEVTLELDISADAHIGPVFLRLQTPLGTSPVGSFLIEPYYGESGDREPNDSPDEAVETYTPAILVGAISKPGDVDYYKIHAQAGEQLVFENGAAALGSALQPLVSIYDADQNLLQEFGLEGGQTGQRFAYRFAKQGAYYIKIADYEERGSDNHFYRFKIGKFPLVLSAYPLGVQKGKTAELALTGYNLGAAKVPVTGRPWPEDSRSMMLRPKTFNQIKIAVGDEPEIESTGKNTTLAAAQPIQSPVTINGKLLAAENDFRFTAHKGETLVFETDASRLGSKLDSLLEVVDAKSAPVERAIVRCVLETAVTLADRDSQSTGIRIVSPTGFAVGDWVLVGSELLKVSAMPRGPDDDMQFTSFSGQRLGFLDTTPEAHAIDTPVYKAMLYPPGTPLVGNGLPLVHLPYRNDDGGPGYGKDSHLRFTAPADGEYILRLRDVRDLHGEDFAYRLTVHPPRPDFTLEVEPRNPNVPAGGRIPVRVTALRLDEFDGPIDVTVEDLPSGFSATHGVIPPGRTRTTILLSADAGAKLERAIPLKVSGRAGPLMHYANPEDKLAMLGLMPPPDITVEAKTHEVVLEPGKTAQVEVAIQRHNHFGGRVPVEVYNLPPTVIVGDVGLNGVLIHENGDRVTFTLEALSNAQPMELPLILAGSIETRSELPADYAAEPVIVKVVAKK